MILLIAVLSLVLWIGGFAFHIAGGFIHILLVIAILFSIIHLVFERGV